MEDLSSCFKTVHDYQLHMPSRWYVEQHLDLEALTQFARVARLKDVTIYEAISLDAKSRLEAFMKANTESKTDQIDLTYHHAPSTQGGDYAYLNFESRLGLKVLQDSLRSLFNDVPLSGQPQRNLGSQISVTYNLPDLWLDY